MPQISQPNAERMPEGVLEGVIDSLELCGACAPESVVHRDQFSNDFAEVRLRNGGAIVVKRGRFEWARSRFQTSRAASRLIRRETDLTVPAPLPLPESLEEPVEAYWRIDLPTLMEIWDGLADDEKARALRSWGALAGELHSIETEGFGPLGSKAARVPSLTDFLAGDLLDRLLPAVLGEWPVAEPAIRSLAATAPEVGARVGTRSRLIHGDLHMGNVLCAPVGESTECVGLIDLETAQAAPPEADLAIMEIHHGPLFDHPIQGPWMAAVLEGYEHPIDRWVVNFYRAYHLLNMGFYSALIGHDWHASRVAEAVEEEVELLLGTK